MKFYCAWYCPFAQRAWMALLHKDLAFDYIEVDPYRETAWWLAISRNRATVPVIETSRTNDAQTSTIVDSTRIVEYIEDRTPDVRPLFPSSPEGRAEYRFWIDHVNERIVPNLYRFLKAADPGEQRDTSRNALLQGMQELVDAMSPEGPYVFGTELSAVDILLIPFAYRIDALLGHYRDFQLPTTTGAWRRYADWYDTLRSSATFRATGPDQQDYRKRLIEHYEPYSRGEG